MPGPRQSLEVLEGKGRKHLSRSERAQRAAGEVRPAPPKQIRAPDYLPQNLRDEFRSLARQLKELGLLSSLDYDTLARYLLARQSYLAATQEVIALQRGAERADGSRVIDTEALDVATRIQDRFFKQCRGCQRHGPDRHQPVQAGAAGECAAPGGKRLRAADAGEAGADAACLSG